MPESYSYRHPKKWFTTGVNRKNLLNCDIFHMWKRREAKEPHKFTKQQKQIKTWNKTSVRLFAECILKSLYASEGQNVSLIRNVVNKLRVNGKNTHSHTRISIYKCVRETKYLCMPQGWSNCASSCEVEIL